MASRLSLSSAFIYSFSIVPLADHTFFDHDPRLNSFTSRFPGTLIQKQTASTTWDTCPRRDSPTDTAEEQGDQANRPEHAVHESSLSHWSDLSSLTLEMPRSISVPPVVTPSCLHYISFVMAILGAHQSVAGGYYKAVEHAREVGCDCVQIFTGPPRQFPARHKADQAERLLTTSGNHTHANELITADAKRFQDALQRLAISHPLAHDSYLINLASPDPALWTKSVDAFVIEMLRADRLGIPYVVTHPGAYTTSSEEAGVAAVIRALDEVHGQTRGLKSRCLLETTAGQGTCLGWRFEQLAAMLDGVQDPDRLGVCVDTCHVFAAGYPLGSEKEYRATMRALDKTVGLNLVRAIHVNDSEKPLGSRVDRHAHIGRGQIGKEAFRLLLNDRRFRNVPMYLETPKGKEKGKDLDVINLRTLRSLIRR